MIIIASDKGLDGKHLEIPISKLKLIYLVWNLNKQ